MKGLTINFCEKHTKQDGDCSLIVAITGSSKYIKEELASLIKEIDSSYGKPCQGIHLKGDGNTEIITPFWENWKG